jgi:hypothetical protein
MNTATDQQHSVSVYFAEIARHQQELQKVRAEGVEALTRLLKIAQGHSGQCRYVANFLLSLYNGTRFKMDLTDFRCLDHEIFLDCIAVLKMDYQPAQEVHCYFKNGGRIWEKLASDWEITDYWKLKQERG